MLHKRINNLFLWNIN